jgi:DNA-directed RNA polymerase subunit RPC12/RpoP
MARCSSCGATMGSLQTRCPHCGHDFLVLRRRSLWQRVGAALPRPSGRHSARAVLPWLVVGTAFLAGGFWELVLWWGALICAAAAMWSWLATRGGVRQPTRPPAARPEAHAAQVRH